MNQVLDRQNNYFTFYYFCEGSKTAPLNGAIGVIIDVGDQVMFYMAENETDWLNTGINHQSLYKRGSSSGLGAIAPIFISFVVALIAIAIIAMICRK